MQTSQLNANIIDKKCENEDKSLIEAVPGICQGLANIFKVQKNI